MLSIRKSIARQSSLQEKYVYLMDILSVVQKVRKELVAMRAFPFLYEKLFPNDHEVGFQVGRVEG